MLQRRRRKSFLPFLAFSIITFVCSACETDSLHPTIHAPTLALVGDNERETTVHPSILVTEGFSDGVSGWHAIPEGEAISEVSWLNEGQLLWSVDLRPGQVAGVFYAWQELATADGLTVHLASLKRSTLLILSVVEEDGSVYSVVMPLDENDPVKFSVAYQGFGLQADSEDENGQLDPGQIVSLSLVDFSSVITPPTPNQVILDKIELWSGDPENVDIGCSSGASNPTARTFNVGVDANYIPQAEAKNQGFWVSGELVDPLELFAANGADAFRLRLWVGDKGESKLDYSTKLAKRAQAVGLQPYLVLFLSEDWSDINKQPAPSVWSDLNIHDRADAVREYAASVAQHFQNEGIRLAFYEIGNEIDYGISGVFADTDHPRDPQTLLETVWPDEAILLNAAMEGIQQVDTEARFMLHIASAWSPHFSLAFFESMQNLAVPYDYIGLSYYPSAFGQPSAVQFCRTLDRLSEEIGKPIIIAETAYPAEPPTGGLFGDWRRAVPGYPLTEKGQALWLADLLSGLQERGDVMGVYVFSPSFWFSGELWGPFALFDGEGNARAAIGSFNAARR
jgi:arabinogalactan endo-1,4-beta-galactosidase